MARYWVEVLLPSTHPAPCPPTCLAGSPGLAQGAATALGNGAKHAEVVTSGYVYGLPGKLWLAGGVGGALPDGFSKKPDL